MWQRYNQTSHIFEKSVDNGANWGPLGLSTAILTEGSLPPQRQWISTAYTDVHNIFTQYQEIQTNLTLRDPGQAVDQRVWRLMNVSGNFYVQSLNDAINAAQGVVQFTRVGGILAGSLTTSGGIVTPDIYLAGDATSAGRWQDYTYTMNHAGFSIGNGSYHGRYTRIAKTVHFECRIVIGSSTAIGSGTISITLPFESVLPYLGVGIPPIFLGTHYRAATGLHVPLFSSMGSPSAFNAHSIASGGTYQASNLASGDGLQYNGFYEST